MTSTPDTPMCGAARDVLPCILDADHGGMYHQDVNGYRWPTAAAMAQAAEDLRPHPHATVTLRPNPADPAEVTVEAESDDMNPAHVAYGLRMAADRFNGHAIAQGHQPIPYGSAAEAATLRARVAELEAAPRILPEQEQEAAYHAARHALGVHAPRIGSVALADALAAAFAAVGILTPPPAPEPNTCPAQFADREGAWHQCENEPGHDPAAGHDNGEWSWPDGVWFARPDEDDA